MDRLRGKVALITGGGRGIGKATAEKFAEEGAQVIIGELDADPGNSTADLINENGGKAEFIQLDVSKKDVVDSCFETIMDKYGKIDILVNNAGILADSTLKKLEEEQFDRVININLKGVYLCTRAAADLMRESGKGVILNASSVVAHYGNFGQTNYVASKAGVIGMTKVWARELGKDGIRVNAVAPGFIKTDMIGDIPEKIMDLMSDKVPLKRMGEPQDIANAYCFLASDEASYINGTVLNVDGGVVI